MDLHAEDITTDRLALRLLQPSDAGWIAREIANPKVHRWLTSVPHPYRKEDAVEFIDLNLSNAGYRVISEQGTPQGVVSITSTDDPASVPDLGYWLMERAWGRGLMTEAASALVAWHQAAYGCAIGSGWITGNTGSENVLRKLGFTDDGVTQCYAHFHDGPVTVHRVKLDTP